MHAFKHPQCSKRKKITNLCVCYIYPGTVDCSIWRLFFLKAFAYNMKTSNFSSSIVLTTFSVSICFRSRSSFVTSGFASFSRREYAFWSLLTQFCFFRGPKIVVRAPNKDQEEESLPYEGAGALTKESSGSQRQLVFRSGFNGGCGRRRRRKRRKEESLVEVRK